MANIVMPTDFSPLANGAVPWAYKMAKALDARVHCLYVVREAQYYGGLDMVLPASLPTSQDLIEAAEERLRDYIETELRAWGGATGAVRLGTPFVEIIRYARDVQAQMIVMSTHGHSGIAHMLLGSTTEAVVRKAGCPVLSIHSAQMRFEMP